MAGPRTVGTPSSAILRSWILPECCLLFWASRRVPRATCRYGGNASTSHGVIHVRSELYIPPLPDDPRDHCVALSPGMAMMSTTKKGKNTPRGMHRSAQPMPAAEPQDVAMIKARKLPMFGPGILIKNIPLSLLPAYMEIYHLEPRGMSATGVLLV